MITDRQCRMARAALAWSIRELAAAAEVGITTVNRFETGQAAPNRSTRAAIQRALEAAGVEFLEGDGVRIRQAAEESR